VSRSVRAPEVLYAEVPDFYAEIERRRAPGLEARPILVGGDPDKRGKVQSTSAEARACGVAVGMPMAEALRLCPDAVRLPTDMGRYREAQSELAACLRRRVEAFEPAGLGGAFVDARHLTEPAAQLAERLVAAVRSELGLDLRVGIAPSKWLAQLVASAIDGGGVRRLEAEAVRAFVAPLPVAVLPRIGRKAEARLGQLGAATIGEAIGLGADVLEEALGARGRVILDLVEGRARATVRAARHPGSISRDHTLGDAPPGPESLSTCLGDLARALERAMGRLGVRARRLALRIRADDQHVTTRSATLGEPADDAAVLLTRALDLLDRAGVDPSRIRSVGLTVAGLEAGGRSDPQLELFPDSTP